MRGPISFLTRAPDGANGPALRLRMPPAWVLMLTTVPLLAAFYLLLPTGGPARVVAYPMFGLLAMGVVLAGGWLRRPARVGSWRLIALALALLSTGDIAYSVLAIDGAAVSYPSYSDVAYLAGYIALILGVVGLFRGRVAGGDRSALIDASILAVGAGSLSWIAIIRPSLEGSPDPLAAAVSMAYPAMDLALLALFLRVMLTAATRPRYFRLLVAGMGLYLVSDVVYAMAVLQGTYSEGQLVDIGWIVGVLLFAVAALHPSAAQVVVPVETSEAKLSLFRLGMLAAAALICPTILLVAEVQSGDELAIGLVIQWSLLFGLVFVRLAATVKALAASLQERRRLQDNLAYEATHDALTKLANRSLFESRLAVAMESAPARTGLVFLDIDDFKGVNDTLGHPTGDEVLRIVASRVSSHLRRADLAARVGGDELAILVEDCADVSIVRAVAERALTSVRAPVEIAGHHLLVHASAGVAMGTETTTAVDLMRDADIAMYQAKSHGKDQVEDFRPAMLGQAVGNFEMRSELALALENGEFVLNYQPAVDLAHGAIVGAEALIRWNHPERGMLGPLHFIPLAESTGLIHPLGRWILREACATAATWPNRLDGQIPAISVNLTVSQLTHPSLLSDVSSILAETGLPPNKLCLEVTESALMDIVPARDALRSLHDLGVFLALDDFGTGYSALNYLAELPFDIVKVDQSFISPIGTGRNVDALLEGILALCASLGLMAVAEGIETEAQLAHLRRHGCPLGQGFLLGRPMTSPAFVATLLEEARAPERSRRWKFGFRAPSLETATP